MIEISTDHGARKMNFEEILVDKRDDIATVTLNRPHKKNAMNAKLRAEMTEFAMVDARELKVVVLTGAGDCFCSGMDQSDATGIEPTYDMWRMMTAILESKAIFIAAVNDRALGGGVTFVNVCDLAMAEEHATFCLPEMRHGIFGPAASPTTLMSIDRKVAAYMILTGNKLTAQKAEQCNLINAVVPKGKLMEEALSWAEHLAKVPHKSLSEAKKGINQLVNDRNARDFGVHLAVDVNRRIRSGDAT